MERIIKTYKYILPGEFSFDTTGEQLDKGDKRWTSIGKRFLDSQLSREEILNLPYLFKKEKRNTQIRKIERFILACIRRFILRKRPYFWMTYGHKD